MKILIISHAHPALSIGGGENAAYALYREFLARPECQPRFMAVGLGKAAPHIGSSFSNFTSDGRETLFHGGEYDYFLFSQLDTKIVWSEFRFLLEEMQPDIVHFHHYVHLGLEFLREVRRYSVSVPIIMTLHEYLAICHHNGQMVTSENLDLCYEASPAACNRCFPHISPSDFKLRELFIKSFFGLVDSFISPSHFLIERYVHWNLPREKIVLIENGQPPVQVQASRRKAIGGSRGHFAFFGQINPYKGITLVFEALALLSGLDDCDISIDIFGGNLEIQPESYQRKFEKLLEPVKHLVRLHQAYSAKDLPMLMAGVDWVVVPSIWWENSPLVIQEAFRSGVPVICADIGGMAEKVLPYKTGLHFRARDPKDLAERLIEAATTPGLWESLVAGIIPPPMISETADAHLRLYQELRDKKRLVRGQGDCI